VASDDGIRYRTATPRDVVVVAAVVAEGFETYRAFAPPGWRPPTAAHHEAEMHQRLGRGDVHSRLAFSGSAAAAFASWMPAVSRCERPERIPGRAHVGALFVRREFWGTGLAGSLLDWIVTGMRASGFAEAQLFTPRDHARARAFYEREGWTHTEGGDNFSPELRLDLVLYERRVA
jgi:GNAT superfamily N-acetyltransferase